MFFFLGGNLGKKAESLRKKSHSRQKTGFTIYIVPVLNFVASESVPAIKLLLKMILYILDKLATAIKIMWYQ